MCMDVDGGVLACLSYHIGDFVQQVLFNINTIQGFVKILKCIEMFIDLSLEIEVKSE